MDPTTVPPNPRPALAPVAGTTSNASPRTALPGAKMSSKVPISDLLSGPPGLGKENASVAPVLGKENAHVAPAPPKITTAARLAYVAKVQAQVDAIVQAEAEKKAANKLKRKAPPVDEATVDLDDFIVEDLPMTENCDQVRRKINRMLDAGGMTKTAFADAIGVSTKSLANFLAMHGAYKGANSASYDNAWAYFKKRDLAGLKLPVKKAAKITATDDAATASAASTSTAAKAPAATKKAQTSSAGVDISAVHLDGEDEDQVPIFESCDVIRRKIDAHLKKPGVTQAQFCRDMLAQFKSASRPANIQSGQLARFRGMKGALTGASSSVFYGAYVFFEKIRVAEGKPKTQHRLDMEDVWARHGGVSRESERGSFICLAGETPVMDSLGRVSYRR